MPDNLNRPKRVNAHGVIAKVTESAVVVSCAMGHKLYFDRPLLEAAGFDAAVAEGIEITFTWTNKLKGVSNATSDKRAPMPQTRTA